MKHRIVIGLVLIVGGVLAPAAQDALYVDPQGDTNVGGDLDVQGNAAVSGAMSVQGDAAVSGTMSVGSIGRLRASDPISLANGPTPVVTLSNTHNWTTLASGTFDYTGGSQLILFSDYSLYHNGSGYPMVDARLVLRHPSDPTIQPIYVPDDIGWRHHTNEGQSHHHKSLSHLVSGLQLPANGLWIVEFQARTLPTSQSSVFHFDGNDTMTVTVLELP